MNLHVDDEVSVDGVHAVVHEVLPFVVWISRDDLIIDVPMDPRDVRLRPWPEVSA